MTALVTVSRVPALQPVDVLLPPPPAVLSRLLVADFSPNSLQNSFLGLKTEQLLSAERNKERGDPRWAQHADLGEGQVAGQRNSFLAQQLLFLLGQLQFWVQLQ